MSIKESEALSNLLIINLFFPVFLFSSFARVQISELRTPIHFQKKVLHVLSWETSTSTTAVFFKCYATKQDLFKPGWRPVGQRKKQHLPYNVFKALYLEDWLSYLRLNNRNATGTLRSSSHVMLQVPLESGTFQDSATSVFSALTHSTMISNSTDFSYFKSQLTKHLKTNDDKKKTSKLGNTVIKKLLS